MVQYLDTIDNTFKDAFLSKEDEENAGILTLGDDLVIESDNRVTVGVYLCGNAVSEADGSIIIRGKDNWRIVES